MRSADILKALDSVGQKWTKQRKTEERRASALRRRADMWAPARTSLKEICFENMKAAWAKASDNGRLPTHWRQVFYVMRPICDGDPDSDRPLTDTTFKGILESYLDEYAPAWDVLRGSRGVFKEPHDGSQISMSTMSVRNYLHAGAPAAKIPLVSWRFPTHGAKNRIAAVLICEKEGFDDLLMAERLNERYHLALMSTKGISALAARHLASKRHYRRDGDRDPVAPGE